MNQSVDAPHTPEHDPTQSSQAAGTILLGGIVALFGLIWLLDTTGAINSPWHAVLPGALILTGLALVASSRGGTHSGLIMLGSVLTVILAVASTINVPLSGNVGERTVAPDSPAQLEASYNHLVGQQIIDLRALDFPANETRLEARVGVGQLVVYVPSDIAVEVIFRVNVGDAEVLDLRRSGFGSDGHVTTPGFAEAQRRLSLDLSVGVGSLRVRHAR